MRTKAVEIKTSLLKCDAADCDYILHGSFSENDFVHYVNKACPKCGAPLLTEEDFMAIKAMYAIAELTNAEVGPVPEGGKRVAIPVEMDGTGKVDWQL